MDGPLHSSYDPFFLAASVAVAALASYTALVLADRIKSARGFAWVIWIGVAAASLGGGIWSMHFLGMLAHSISVPIAYDLKLTALSLLVPILVAAVGFTLACQTPVDSRRVVVAGVLAGLGIVAMHYIGMAAIVTPASIRWDPLLVALSAVIALCAATASFWFAARLDATLAKVGASALMAVAIAGMHYTGMAAAHFYRTAQTPADAPIALDPILIGIIVAVGAMLFLFAVLASAFAERAERERSGSDAKLLTFRGALLLVMGFVVLLVSGGWGILTWTDYADTIRRAEVTVGNAVQIVGESALRVIGERDLVLRILKERLESDGIDQLKAPDYRASLLAAARLVDGLGIVAVIDADGRVAFNTGRAPLGYDASDRVYYRMHRDARIDGLAVTETLTGGVTDRTFFAISRRLEAPDGRFLGVVAALIYTDAFQEAFASVDLGPNASLLLYRHDAKVLVRVPPFPPGTSLDVSYSSLFLTKLPQSPVGTYHAVRPIDGKQVVVSYRRLAGTPFVTAVTITHDAVLDSWRQRLKRSIAFAFAAMLVCVALAIVALRTIQREEKAQSALQALNVSLEERVRARTADLESAVADRDILLREVHHRVKNNMQVLQSLIRMTGRRVPPESRSAFEALSHRIWAMGQVHTQVYATGEPSKLSLHDYLGRLCEYMSQSFDLKEIQMHRSLEPIEIDLDSAIPLGLIAVECIQNAYKHAFPAGAPGEIWVTLDTSDDLATLTVRDTGVGVEQEKLRRSTGLMLIEALAGQINATLTMESDTGTTLKVTFPRRKTDATGDMSSQIKRA